MEQEVKEGLSKLAEFIIEFKNKHQESAREDKKTATKVASTLSKDEGMTVKLAEAYGRGLAAGMGLSQAESPTEDTVYGGVINGISEVWGEKVAQQVDEGLQEYSKEHIDDPQKEIFEEVKEVVAPVVVDAHGGKEKVIKAIEENPEVEKELDEEVDEVAAVAMQEVMNAAAAEGAPAEQE